MRRRLSLAATAVLVLSACATPTDRDRATSLSVAALGSLEELAASLPGLYGAARRLDQERAGTQMLLSTRAGNNGTLVLEFQELLEQGQRGFMLTLGELGNSPFIPGVFVPLQADGSPSAHSCAMRFRVRDGLLSGETDPDQCRFGSGESGVGLLKEVALDGSRIVIADQLIDFSGQESDTPDVLRLYRLESFQGQVRVRDQAEGGWRTANTVQLETGARPIEPTDAADMTLGVSVRLELIQGQQPAYPLLYLQAADAETGKVLGQAWADPQAWRLGLALERVQIDLEKRRPGR